MTQVTVRETEYFWFPSINLLGDPEQKEMALKSGNSEFEHEIFGI